MVDQASVEGEVVAGAGVSGAPAWQRLHGEMKSATRRRCAWDAEHARHLREAEAMRLWHYFGYVSILEYLEREHGIDPRTASDRLRVSHALGELPLLEAELEDGTFQYSHVKELTRVVTPDTEDDWIKAAKGKTCAEVQAMVAGHKKGDDPEDPDDPDLRLRRFTVELPPRTVAMYRELWAEIEAELGHRIEEAEFFRIMIERAQVSPEGASTPAQISICSHCERGWQSGPGGRAEFEPADLARVQCDAEHLGAVDGEPGRKTATLSRKKRARILARDQHRCVVPGCRSKRNLDVHHIIHREDGGGHEDWNTCTLCTGHHAAHHRGHLAIEGRAPDGIRFTWIAPDAEASANTNPYAHVGTNSAQPLRTQAHAALVGLGWKNGIAGAAVDAAVAHVGTNVGLDALIREALRAVPETRLRAPTVGARIDEVLSTRARVGLFRLVRESTRSALEGPDRGEQRPQVPSTFVVEEAR